MRQFVDAANRGDVQGVANTFAPTAHFDSIGRIYDGRDQIMDRFLVPEVINLGGQYEIVNVQHEPDAVTFEFNFQAGSLREHFTYRAVVRDNQIQDVVGRYVTNSPASSPPASTPASTPAPSATTSTGAPAAVPAAAQCYMDAVNAQNLDGLVGCFAPDGVVIDVNRRIAGADAIRTWANNEVIGGTLEVIESEPQNNGVRLLVHWAPRGSNGWKAYYTFTDQGDRITQADLQYAR